MKIAQFWDWDWCTDLQCLVFYEKKSRTRETLNISTNADSITIAIKFSKHRPSGQMLSISRMFVCLSVHLSVRLSVCSLLRYRLNVFFPPLPKVGYPIILEIRNPWGKVMERSGLRFEQFLFESCLKSPRNFFGWFFPFFKKIGFLGILGPPGNHASRWIRDLWLMGVSLILAYF